MLGGSGSPGGDELLTVTVVRDEHGYGMKVSGDHPVYVQSVKEHGAAWRCGLRAGDRILKVDGVPVHRHTHQQVVHMIQANSATVLTVHQNTSRHKTPITAPLPVNSEKQRQLEASKAQTVRLMLDQELKYMRDLRNELSKVPDVRKQAQLESAQQRCSTLQHEIDTIMATQPEPPIAPTPITPTPTPQRADKPPPPSFLSGLPRSLSNLTNQSLRNLRQRTQKPDSEEKRRPHNHTVPLVPVTCLDNAPPPLPPRAVDRRILTPPLVNPLAKPKPSSMRSKYKMVQSVPAYNDNPHQLRRSSQSLDGELDGPQPNSIALQMNYPLVNVPPPPLQTDNRNNVPVLHVRSQSSPEHLDHGLSSLCSSEPTSPPPPGTPPPPYQHNTQPCADPQRAIISMEDDDSPSSDNSTYSGLFMNLRTVRESKARMAVLLNWLLGERRSACPCLVLILTEGYRLGAGATLRRWAYELHSTFTMPHAVLQLNGVDENMANEIEHVLVNEHDKEEILRNVFRKARQKAKEELGQLLTEFQVKRQVGLATLYGPDDTTLHRCQHDKQQEQVVVERVLCGQLKSLAGGGNTAGGGTIAGAADARGALLAAVIAAALQLQCRPASVAAAVGGSKASFLQRDKLYKQRVKQINKQHPQPFVVRGHHLQLQALTAVAHCHACDLVIAGLAPQAYVCADCKLRVHRGCARAVEEGCCLDNEHHNNRISRFMERIHQTNNQDSNEKKSRKTSGTAHFLNMERSFRKMEDDTMTEQNLSPSLERRDESDESLYESADCHSDAISASDDALPRLSKTPTMSKESLKIAVTDEETDVKVKKGHRKTMSLSNPLEMVRNLGDEWFEKKDLDKNSDRKKSRESLWSEEDRESNHGSSVNLQNRKNSKKEEKSQPNSRKSSATDAPKSRKTSKGSSVSALNLFRRRKTPTSTKPEVLAEAIDTVIPTEEILNYTKLFLEEEKRHATVCDERPDRNELETDTEEDVPSPKILGEQRRRLSRQTSRSKSKVRGKSQSVKVNTLRKSHSGTLKKNKKKGVKTPLVSRSRQASIVEMTPLPKKKHSDVSKHNTWLFSVHRGETRREGSNEEPPAPDADVDVNDAANKESSENNNWRSAPSSGRGVNRAESCRERDAPRRGKHRNASDPNRLTAHNHHDLEPGAATAPSGSSSSSSLSSRSNESNTVAADQQAASQSDLSEEEEALAAQWADSLPPHVLESLDLTSKQRKRQEVIHELVVSEGSHVRWLKVLHVVFLKPLQSTALLAADELRALFPNLPALRERHARLHSDLRAARATHVVPIAAVANAVLNTLGDPTYAPCLSAFCSGQRLALEGLREKRRKHKELHAFLHGKEQHPLCGRLQLRDLLACVWQRLTKYQLLLEGILKTCGEEDSDEDVELLKRALQVAKDVLHCVDTAIKTNENEHRLRYIQSRLEVRAGSEWDELRRLELTQHRLRVEGDLAIRNDSNKKAHVRALMLDDYLVLLQREGDKFILKPIPQPSQQGLLSPLIKWEKVLFRPNAAVRNTFFLMNINGVQMHELSTNTTAEFTTWVKHIQESPLAKLTELKPNITPSHTHSRSTDDSGINVSRNPSDASEKSNSTAPVEETESERDKTSLDSSWREKENEKRQERDKSCDKEELTDTEEKHTPRRPTVGRISVHSTPPPVLSAPTAVHVRPPLTDTIPTATTVCTDHERLRRLEASISKLLLAKRTVVCRMLGVPGACAASGDDSAEGNSPGDVLHVEEIAVADALGLVDSDETLLPPGGMDVNPEPPSDIHHLLLAAHAQVNQLTELLNKALTVDESATLSKRIRSSSGRCDSCRSRCNARHAEASSTPAMAACSDSVQLQADASFDMLNDLDDNAQQDQLSLVLSRVSAMSSVTCQLRSVLATLTRHAPAAAVRTARTEMGHARDYHRLCNEPDQMSLENLEQNMHEHPSNGG